MELNPINYVCGGCGSKYSYTTELQGQTKKICPKCGYGLFMIVENTIQNDFILNASELNSKQKDIISYLKEYFKDNDNMPSTKEIQDSLSLQSISTVYYHLNSLKKKGYITFKQGRVHTIKLLPKAISEENLLCVSEKQCELLKIIKYYIEDRNESPTTLELQNIIGVQSSATLAYHLSKLQEYKLIEKVRYRHRSLCITEEGHKLLKLMEEKEVN